MAVLVGGAAGTGVRMALDDGFGVPFGVWPWPTFAVNVAGSFVLAVVLTRLLARARTSLAVPLLGAGAMGALTTFSTFTVETWRMGELGRPGLAVLYVTVSVVAGVVAAIAGARLVGGGG